MNFDGKKTADCYYSNMGVGGDGTDINFRAESLDFLGQLNDIVISASYNTEGALSTRPHVGIIGNELLKHYDLIIDAPHEAIYARSLKLLLIVYFDYLRHHRSLQLQI